MLLVAALDCAGRFPASPAAFASVELVVVCVLELVVLVDELDVLVDGVALVVSSEVSGVLDDVVTDVDDRAESPLSPPEAHAASVSGRAAVAARVAARVVSVRAENMADTKNSRGRQKFQPFIETSETLEYVIAALVEAMP